VVKPSNDILGMGIGNKSSIKRHHSKNYKWVNLQVLIQLIVVIHHDSMS
jgi:hypothetical protein